MSENAEESLWAALAEEERAYFDNLLIDTLINGPKPPTVPLTREQLIALSVPLVPMENEGEQITNTFYRIIERATGKAVPCFHWPAHDQYNFSSPEEARNSNCHGIFKDKEKYSIAKFTRVSKTICSEVECDS